jgi:hypothetical protein
MRKSTQLWRRWPVWLFGGFWVVGVVYFTLMYLMNPYEISPEGPMRGHTYPGELADVLGVTAVEFLAATVLLRPWSYRRSWGRALIAAAVFAPWSFIRMVMGMHAGPATHAHSLWMLLFCVGLVGAAVVSGIAAVRAARLPPPVRRPGEPIS